MNLHYDFLTPPRIMFGWGRRSDLGVQAARLGRRAFLIWGSRVVRAHALGLEIVDSLAAADIEVVEAASISCEPDAAHIDRLAADLRQAAASAGDIVVAVGGGSAIDLAKAAAAMAVQSERTGVGEYLEGVGRGLSINTPPLPIVAVPTTAGTGSEATRNAVVSSFDPPYKKSLRSDLLMPRLALVDPELTTTAPPHVTAASGMDAITQLIESYVSRRARPVPRALAIDGVRRAMPALAQLASDPGHRSAREAMAHAALLSGMALANSGLGLAHGVAAALGACCRVGHGLACAVMLPAALRVNRTVCEEQFAELAAAIGLPGTTAAARADALVAAIEDLLHTLDIPVRLGPLGVRREQIPELVRASRGNSMDGNPRTLDDAELHELLESIL